MEEKNKGIIETLKAAKTEKEVVELAKEIETYNQASLKTVRKFARIARRKRASFKKK